jgi:hypothetical protein
MRATNLSDKGLLIEVDVQELRILATALKVVCNGGHVLDDLEQRLSGTRDKAETLLVSLRSLNSIFDRLLIEHEEPVRRPASNKRDVFLTSERESSPNSLEHSAVTLKKNGSSAYCPDKPAFPLPPSGTQRIGGEGADLPVNPSEARRVGRNWGNP